MELFSEIYSAYYHVVNRILRRAKGGITEKEMIRQVEEDAYGESSLFIVPKLTGGQWDLLTKKEGTYYSDKVDAVSGNLTTLQLSYIKSLLGDERLGLFLNYEERVEVQDLLEEYPALFDCKDFRYYDQFLDGDDYTEEGYREKFSILMRAIKEKKLVRIRYREQKSGDVYLPVNLEYSSKNNKFRLAAVQMIHGKGKVSKYLLVNRMEQVELLDEVYENDDGEELFGSRIKREWVEFEIYNERNALERCTLHFSNYEKHIEYVKERDCWICRMYYDWNDQMEILVSLLSFGPVIKVLGPVEFVEMVKIRLYRQRKVMGGY